MTVGEKLRSSCFEDLSLRSASVIPSYRKTCDMLNRIRWQDDEDLIKLRTLSDYIEREGSNIIDTIHENAVEILSDNGFDEASGKPIDEESISNSMVCPEYTAIPIDEVNTIIDAYNEGKDRSRQIDEVQIHEQFIADEYTVNVSVDDVGTVEQKATGRSKNSQKKENRHYVKNTVIHIQQGAGRYILDGLGISNMLKILVAFLLHNKLLENKCLVFFTDGASDIRAAIKSLFNWIPYRIILDWHHLEKKCQERLSMAMKGSKLRNEALEELLALLWLGKVDAAIEYLRSIGVEKIRNRAEIERLIAYFDRNWSYIPCYALRKLLNLRVSSNRGEKANDLVVANRQKHNGMSWSKSGSSSLANVSAMFLNKENENWINRREIAFKLIHPENKAAA